MICASLLVGAYEGEEELGCIVRKIRLLCAHKEPTLQALAPLRDFIGQTEEAIMPQSYAVGTRLDTNLAHSAFSSYSCPLDLASSVATSCRPAVNEWSNLRPSERNPVQDRFQKGSSVIELICLSELTRTVTSFGKSVCLCKNSVSLRSNYPDPQSCPTLKLNHQCTLLASQPSSKSFIVALTLKSTRSHFYDLTSAT